MRLHHTKTEIPVDIFWHEESSDIAQEEQNNIKMTELVKQYPPEIYLRFLLENPENDRMGRFLYQSIKSQVFPVDPEFIHEQPERYLPLTGIKYENREPVRLGQIVDVWSDDDENYAIISFDDEKAEYILYYGKDKQSEPIRDRIVKKYGQVVLSHFVNLAGSIFSKKEYIINYPKYKDFLEEFDRVIWLFKER